MRPSTLISSLLFGSTQAFIIPEGLPDGAYTASIDHQGNLVGEPTMIRPLEAHEYDANNSTLARRQANLPSPEVNCHNRVLNRADYNSALASFNNICNGGDHYPAHSTTWITAGSAVVYMCNYANSNRCWPAENNQADALMNVNCGSNGVGWVYVDAYKKSIGRENAGVSIC
jgi:hypothetical protein